MFSKKFQKIITIKLISSSNNNNILLLLFYYVTLLLILITNFSPNIIKCLEQQKQQPLRKLLTTDFSRNLIVEQVKTTTTTTTTPSPVPLPDFSEPIENQTVALGRDAQLSCKIENLGNFRTAWLRVEDKGILTIHNNIITRNYRFGLINNDDGKNFILTIKNVQASDRGGYMCQINSVPMKYAVGYLDVLTPPAFDDSAPPNVINDNQGDQPSLTSGQQQLVSSGSGSVQTTPQPAAAGVITVSEGGNATLSCRANGHPQPVITWRREDNEPILLYGSQSIESQQQNTKFEGPSLQLSSITRLNSGAYLCIASNGVQPSASKRQILDVQYSPIIRIPETEIGAQLNQQSVKLSCFVESNPVGTYHWAKLSNNPGIDSTGARRMSSIVAVAASDDLSLIEHDELLNSDKFEIVIKHVSSEKVHMILNIRQVEKQDFAWYKCIAKNSLGIQSNLIHLYETAAVASPASGSSSSSTFTFTDMFNRALGSSNKNQLNEQQQQDDSTQQQSAGGRAGSGNKQGLSRAHTRSSWTQQRPNNNRFDPSHTKALLGDNSHGSSSASSSSASFNSYTPLLIVSLLSLWSSLLLLRY